MEIAVPKRSRVSSTHDPRRLADQPATSSVEADRKKVADILHHLTQSDEIASALGTAAHLAVILLLYAVFFGPFMWMAQRGLLPEFTGVLYVPLMLLYGESKEFQSPINWYVGLFGIPGG